MNRETVKYCLFRFRTMLFRVAQKLLPHFFPHFLSNCMNPLPLLRYSRNIALLLTVIFLVVVPAHAQGAMQSAPTFPFKQAGLTDRQAAAYLLDRFTFGARPNDIDALLQKGCEVWFAEQIQGNISETVFQERLTAFSTLTMTNEELVRIFPNGGLLLRQAIQDGMISKDLQANKDKVEYRQELKKYAESKGYRPKRELYGEMYAQKLLRAVYSPNQLREVLTDFWFNHFNVSITDNQADQYVMTYERDAIRPNALGNFHTLLLATAKHPAMLAYLDNAQSTAPDGTPTTLSLRMDSLKNLPGIGGKIKRRAIENAQKNAQAMRDSALQQVPEQMRPRKGINENYARELMELHTLGVDGGYTQRDVTEAARILTGWTIYPYGVMLNENRAKKLEQWLQQSLERGKNAGFVREGDFLFRADAHDATEKTFLGVKFTLGGGMNEGEQLLNMLAIHPATAAFICTKIARRFVGDVPPEALVQRMAATFLQNRGNIREVLTVMAYSEEFWNAGKISFINTASANTTTVNTTTVNTTTVNTASNLAKAKLAKKSKSSKGKQILASEGMTTPVPMGEGNISQSPMTNNRTKIKSPFELAVSALRALNAEVKRPREVLEWVRKIGQPLYAYQAPTGFPDRAESWINTGSLLNRMNFGLNLALGNIGGVVFDLAALNHNHEPQSLEDALETYCALLMPERNHAETVRLLKPHLADPTFAQKIDEAANKEATKKEVANNMMAGGTMEQQSSTKNRVKQGIMPSTGKKDEIDWDEPQPQMPKNTSVQTGAVAQSAVAQSAVAQVVGIILGSPEFQRR
jgi:uncharacterized protein (DUF1800 family)